MATHPVSIGSVVIVESADGSGSGSYGHSASATGEWTGELIGK